jgi:hypothetical protein
MEMSQDRTVYVPCSTFGDVPIPTCLFGSCNNSFVPACVCFEGFRHDRMIGRFNNCGLPTWIPWLGGALSFTATLLGFVYGLYVAVCKSVTWTNAWRVAVSASFASLMFFGATISLHVEPDLEMPVYGALFNNFGTASIAYSVGIMVRNIIA